MKYHLLQFLAVQENALSDGGNACRNLYFLHGTAIESAVADGFQAFVQGDRGKRGLKTAAKESMVRNGLYRCRNVNRRQRAGTESIRTDVAQLLRERNFGKFAAGKSRVLDGVDGFREHD